jgi:hypothetical protein
MHFAGRISVAALAAITVSLVGSRTPAMSLGLGDARHSTRVRSGIACAWAERSTTRIGHAGGTRWLDMFCRPAVD